MIVLAGEVTGDLFGDIIGTSRLADDITIDHVMASWSACYLTK
jgi:hypothetical protein